MVKPAALAVVLVALGCAACGGAPSTPSSVSRRGVTWLLLTDLSPLAGTGWTGTGTASDDSTSYTFTSALSFTGIGQLDGVNVQQGNAVLDSESQSSVKLVLKFWGTANMFDLHRGCAIVLPSGSVFGGATPSRWETLEQTSDGKRIRLTVSGWFGVLKDGSFIWTKTS